MSFLDNCRRLVGLESTPGHGNLAAAEFAGRLCEEAGLHVEYQRESVEGAEQCNVIARPQAELPPREILFQTHLDTIEPGHFGHWTMTQANPFNASIYNDLIYGLGAADVKLDFLCKLEAMKEFTGKKLRTPFVLVGTFGAQTGMTGAIKLIRRKKLNAVSAFIGEPTDMKLVVAGKGLAVVEIAVPFSPEERAYRLNHDLMESSSSQSRMFSGKSAAGNENAIMKMLAYLAQLPEGIALMDLNGGINHSSMPLSSVLEIDMVAGFKDPILPKISKIFSSLQVLEKELQEFREEGFDPPYPTVNMGMIRTSETEVRITGCCRLPPSVTDAAYEEWMAKLEKAVREVGATFRVTDYRKGFTTDAQSEFVQTAQGILAKMGLPPEVHKITGATEASVLSRLGIECLVWGPGQSVGNSHAPNENIKLSDLKTATEFYKRLIERFCL
ncbi:MAG: M20 family metallopeptidase [Bdellovibrionales bacterium]